MRNYTIFAPFSRFSISTLPIELITSRIVFPFAVVLGGLNVSLCGPREYKSFFSSGFLLWLKIFGISSGILAMASSEASSR